MPMMYYSTGNWSAMLLMMLLSAAVWIAVIGLLFWAVNRLFTNRVPTTEGPDRSPSALEILRQRYARGEIDAATFDAMKRQIEATATPAGIRD
jgi:putative membrane protein